MERICLRKVLDHIKQESGSRSISVSLKCLCFALPFLQSPIKSNYCSKVCTMFFSRFFKPSYASVHSIESSDYEDEESKHGVQAPVMLRPTGMTIKIGLCHAIILAVLFCTSIVSTWVLLLKNPNQINLTNPPVKTQWQCAQPSVRREWRSLVPVEKKQYIEAVQCLETKPSRLRNNGTLYDDFPWVHKLTSVQSMFGGIQYFLTPAHMVSQHTNLQPFSHGTDTSFTSTREL